MVSRTKERALDPLLVPALLAGPGHAVNMLTDERRSARHPGSASMQLHGTARHCRLLCQSLRGLKSCATLAPSPPHGHRVMPGHV
eukprot:scaffold135146_cov66-Phaeocystis_antarctica.AAC.2